MYHGVAKFARPRRKCTRAFLGWLRFSLRSRRRAILRLIQNAELPAGKIAARFEVTRPAISQHLRVLVEAGLVTVRRDSTRLLYRMRPEGMAELRQYLEEFWDDSLRMLKQAAEAHEGRSHGSPTTGQ